MYKTTNGGQSWDSLFTKVVIGKGVAIHAMSFTDVDNGVIAGVGASFTTDGGHTWNKAYTETNYPEAIQFFNDTLGYMVGWYSTTFGTIGTLDQTTDGGKQWLPFFYPQKIPNDLYVTHLKMKAISFPSARVGWIGGERYPGNTGYPNSRILRTLDSGQTFDTVSQVLPHTVNCIGL